MEQLENIINKQPEKMTAIEYAIWRLWLFTQNNNPKGDGNQKTFYDAQRAAAELAELKAERDALREAIQKALVKLGATQENWREDCLFQCNDILRAALKAG